MFSKAFRVFQSKMILFFPVIALFMLSGCPPVITGFTPERGPVETEVTIQGENFFSIQYVKFGDSFAYNFNTVDLTTIKADVPGDATTGKIQVRNSSGTGVSANDFIVERRENWARTYHYVDNQYASFIHETQDGGYIVSGYGYFGTSSTELWILKLDADGEPVWQRRYGDSGSQAPSLYLTTDGGYIVARGTGGIGSDNVWILKLDADGEPVWKNTYGGPGDESVYSIQQTTDGGYIVAGNISSSGDVDPWILKLKADGEPAWQKTYGDLVHQRAYSMHQTTDDGFIVAGITSSIGGGPTNDLWIMKLFADGTPDWLKTYDNLRDEFVFSIQQTFDQTGNPDGYIVAATTDAVANYSEDLWILKLRADGEPVWQKTYGGSSDEFGFSIQQTTDNGYIVAGYTYSFGAGGYDLWILKLDADGKPDWQKTYGGPGDEEAHSIHQTTDGGYIVAGQTTSFGAGNNDLWVLKLDAYGNISEFCPSGIGEETFANDVDTQISPQSKTPILTPPPNLTVTPNTATVTDTQATIETQCTN